MGYNINSKSYPKNIFLKNYQTDEYIKNLT